jgi:hypothetical protein
VATPWLTRPTRCVLDPSLPVVVHSEAGGRACAAAQFAAAGRDTCARHHPACQRAARLLLPPPHHLACNHPAPAKWVASQQPYYMKQTIGNACGTIAMLHALGNNLDRLTIGE